MPGTFYHTRYLLPYPVPSTIPGTFYHTRHLLPHQAPSTTPGTFYHTRYLLPYPVPSTIPGTFYHTRYLLPHPVPSTIPGTFYHTRYLLPYPVPSTIPGTFYHIRYLLPYPVPSTIPGPSVALFALACHTASCSALQVLAVQLKLSLCPTRRRAVGVAILLTPFIHSYAQQCMQSNPVSLCPTASLTPTRNRAPHLPAHSLFTTLTELSRLEYSTRWIKKSAGHP